MTDNFYENTTLIKYSKNDFDKIFFAENSKIIFSKKNEYREWLNTYGDKYFSEFSTIINDNGLDDFLIRMLKEEHSNKVVELDNILFITINILKTGDSSLIYEQMMFILTNDFIWSIQEKKGDYFEPIRENLMFNKGIVRNKKIDYLLFLILDSIITNYELTFQKLSDQNDKLFKISKIEPTASFISLIETRKQEVFNFKKATRGLRDIITKLENIGVINIRGKYFSEIKEQANNLLSDIDFELQELEGKINLVFNIQGQKLNEIMKTLTIFSVIFIPLTFLAGIYGMNFSNMPELKTRFGYYILLVIMTLVSLLSILFFKRKKWF